MNDDARSRPECERYADELAELALGTMTGRERAHILAHVESCPGCQAEMEQLSLAADSLLEVVPGVEPPLGFEVRLMERLGTGGATRRLVRRHWRLRQSALVLACLLLLAAAGVGAGWLVRGAGSRPPVAADRVRDRARRPPRNGIPRLRRPRPRRGRRVLGPNELALHDPRRRLVVRGGHLPDPAGGRDHGSARHVLAREGLRGLERRSPARDRPHPTRLCRDGRRCAGDRAPAVRRSAGSPRERPAGRQPRRRPGCPATRPGRRCRSALRA